jgi:hypothetical protein
MLTAFCEDDLRGINDRTTRWLRACAETEFRWWEISGEAVDTPEALSGPNRTGCVDDTSPAIP